MFPRVKYFVSFVAGIIALSTYGHEVVHEDDPYIELVEKSMRLTVGSGAFSTTIIDIFPFCKYFSN